MPPRRRYPIEQPATQDKGAQQAYGSQQRVLDKIAGDIDGVDTRLAASIAALPSSIVGSAAYTPGTPGDWDGTPPTTLQEALDRIAARINAEHTGP